MEATRFRSMPDMTWPEARAALNRLRTPIADYRHHGTTAEYVALAEFALTAHDFTGFAGLRGEHGVKLRQEIADVILLYLRKKLGDVLHAAERLADTVARPITNRLHGEGWRGNRALWVMVPIGAERWAPVNEASPDQAIAALDHLRAVHATWQAHRADADTVNARMIHGSTNLPTAAAFAEALHVAEMLAFTGEKLSILYAAVMHSMPIYRLYPATAEAEAFALWWPWGRPPPLIDGGPPQPPKPRKATLDPASIAATRPHDVVREVMEKTGIDRTTAQRLTAGMRRGMRIDRQHKAEKMLRTGATKAEVARVVGLSPSRISAMFKGVTFPKLRRAAPPDDDAIDDDMSDDGDDI
jgi:hypothetical protein